MVSDDLTLLEASPNFSLQWNDLVQHVGFESYNQAVLLTATLDVIKQANLTTFLHQRVLIIDCSVEGISDLEEGIVVHISFDIESHFSIAQIFVTFLLHPVFYSLRKVSAILLKYSILKGTSCTLHEFEIAVPYSSCTEILHTLNAHFFSVGIKFFIDYFKAKVGLDTHSQSLAPFLDRKSLPSILLSFLTILFDEIPPVKFEIFHLVVKFILLLLTSGLLLT